MWVDLLVFFALVLAREVVDEVLVVIRLSRAELLSVASITGMSANLHLLNPARTL